jgi:hypothetical protein
MRAAMVRPNFFWKVESASMSDLIEIIYPQSMTAKLLQNGEVIAEYKVEQCDSCEKLVKFDKFGYTKGQGREKLIWLCGLCR